MVSMKGRIGAIWGVLGISALLVWAIFRLFGYAAVATHMSWAWYEWAFFIFWMAFMLYGEGYKGFQRGFSPRVVARAVHLAYYPVWWHVLLAPLYCMGYIHATRKRRIVSISVTSGIILLIIGVHQLPQPWHGIVDIGVVSGLIYGVLAMWVYAFNVIVGRGIDHPADVPSPKPLNDEAPAAG